MVRGRRSRRERWVVEVPRSLRRRLIEENACCICGSRENLEIHHLDKFPTGDGMRVNVLCKHCHKAVTKLEIWYWEVYHNVVKPYLAERAIVLDVEKLFPKLTKFMGDKRG